MIITFFMIYEFYYLTKVELISAQKHTQISGKLCTCIQVQGINLEQVQSWTCFNFLPDLYNCAYVLI